MNLLLRVLLCLPILVPMNTASPQLLLQEDFDFTDGDSLVSRGWNTNQSTITNAILVHSPGLQYPGHPGSGIGLAAQLVASGQDVYREFAPVTEGALYIFLLLRVQSASSGDYVLHLQPSPKSTSYFSRLFVRQGTNGKLAFGIAKRGTNASPTFVYSDSVYNLETTTCVVLKYQFNAESDADDQACLYVFDGPPLPSAEPPRPTAGPASDATNDASTLSVLTLRQGDASRAPTLLLDGIRVSTSWDAWLAVTIQEFTALAVGDRTVQLAWTTSSEVNCYGFYPQRAAGNPAQLADIAHAFLPGHGSSLSPHFYTYRDTLPSDGTWYYRLRVVDLDGSSSFSSTVSAEVLTTVESPPPQGLRINQNFPNPFNAETRVSFTIPTRTHVLLEIFDALGREVGTLFDEVLGAGEHSLPVNAIHWPGGVYICRIRAAGFERVTKMVLVR